MPPPPLAESAAGSSQPRALAIDCWLTDGDIPGREISVQTVRSVRQRLDGLDDGARCLSETDHAAAAGCPVTIEFDL